MAGGAISQAKGALSSWWSNLTTVQSPTDAAEPATEAVAAAESLDAVEALDTAEPVAAEEHPVVDV